VNMPARKDLDRHLEKEPLLPFYAFVGAEPVLVFEAVVALRKKVLTKAAQLNRDEFRAGDAEISAVLAAAQTLPMMAPLRWVHLSDISRLKAPEQAELCAYLDKPCAKSVLCLSGDKLDQRTKLALRLIEAKALFVLEPPKQRALAAWIFERAEKRGFKIGRDACQLLADLIGAEIGPLDRALEKLSLYAGESKVISSEDVEIGVASTRAHSIFELTDAIGQRDLARALILTRAALSGGENALMLLSMIVRQLRHLLRTQELLGRDASDAEIASQLGVPPFLVQALRNQATRYEPAELMTALTEAGRADRRLKSSRLRPEVVLDKLLTACLVAP
jgi:DNA polymerase-3 subunit delta